MTRCERCKETQELYELTLILCHACRIELEKWLRQRCVGKSLGRKVGK